MSQHTVVLEIAVPWSSKYDAFILRLLALNGVCTNLCVKNFTSFTLNIGASLPRTSLVADSRTRTKVNKKRERSAI
jgi:hypothetical protein